MAAWLMCSVAMAAWLMCSVAMAQGSLTAMARVTGADGVVLSDRGSGTEITMTLSQPVPWRVFTLDNPRRVVMDFSEVAWTGVGFDNDSGNIVDARTGVFQPGWSRLVADLVQPMKVSEAALKTGAVDGSATLTVRLEPVTAEDFSSQTGAAESAEFAEPKPRAQTRVPTSPRRPDRPLVVLDPGHGGIDPGAEAGGLQEAALMLTFARELKDTLLRTGNFDVAMTRDEDVFVSLEGRITIARSARADVFLSLHADALAEGAGSASGATVYTLSDSASDAASLALAERHNRSDLLAGVDLSHQSDEIALVLMELARAETAPRAEILADTIVDGFRDADIKVNNRPRRSAAFSVLKSPDFPSVLIEIGFLSSERDRRRLADPVWRALAADGIASALELWTIEDAAQARLLRQ
jgi:N-acetylmuramoyl-L-alanine amidase